MNPSSMMAVMAGFSLSTSMFMSTPVQAQSIPASLSRVSLEVCIDKLRDFHNYATYFSPDKQTTIDGFDFNDIGVWDVTVPSAWDKPKLAKGTKYLSDYPVYKTCTKTDSKILPYTDPKEPLMWKRTFYLDSKYYRSADIGTLKFDFGVINNNDISIGDGLDAFNSSYGQKAYFTSVDGDGNVLGVSNSSIFKFIELYAAGMELPTGTRAVTVRYYSNYPFLCFEEIAMRFYKQDYADTFQKIVDRCFIFAGALIFIVPLAILIESFITHRRFQIKMVDLLLPQGTRMVRALMYASVMAFLFTIFHWLTAKVTSSNSQEATLAIFGGISSAQFSGDDVKKTLKTAIYIAMFVLTGFLYFPVFVCYAHTVEKSRTAAVLGFLGSLNLSLFRLGMTYVASSPNRPLARYIAMAFPEQLCLLIIVIYFAASMIVPNVFENQFRKTNYSDMLYVRLLLKAVPQDQVRKLASEVEQEETAKEKTTVIGRFLALFKKKKVYVPEFLQLPKSLSLMQRYAIYMTNVRVPPKLIASIMMMFLFTYTALVGTLVKVIDNNSTISCVLGLAGGLVLNAFSIFSQVMGAISGGFSLGENLSDTLEDLKDDIKSQAGNDFIDKFYNMILAAAICGCVLTFLLLIFNIMDFVRSFYEDLARLRRGDYSKMDKTDREIAIAGYAVSYMGIQIGYVLIGTICKNGLLFASLAVSLALSYAQLYIVNLLFIAKIPVRGATDKNGKPYMVNTKFWAIKKIGYNHIDYFFLFPNLISGLIGFISQLVMLILGSAIFAYRLDIKNQMSNSLMRSKYAIYNSWLIQEHHYSNPVLRIACMLFRDSVETGETLKSSQNPCRRRAILRWQLAYTLVQNPSVLQYRKERVVETIVKAINRESEIVDRALAFRKIKLHTMLKDRSEKKRLREYENDRILQRIVSGRGDGELVPASPRPKVGGGGGGGKGLEEARPSQPYTSVAAAAGAGAGYGSNNSGKQGYNQQYQSAQSQQYQQPQQQQYQQQQQQYRPQPQQQQGTGAFLTSTGANSYRPSATSNSGGYSPTSPQMVQTQGGYAPQQQQQQQYYAAQQQQYSPGQSSPTSPTSPTGRAQPSIPPRDVSKTFRPNFQ
ncbi:hypothetical protein HDU76_003855 [Blyttiomyces sp. JEL0837]|nr:hypothetical protein HDU76_003855 [Blyttiomyces sp. JEL0837]